METKYWKLNCEEREAGQERSDSPADLEAIAEAAEMLRAGDTVAFPTETVYGLGADARNTEAVEAIFQAKGRPSDNPLIVHIADRAALEELVTDVPAAAAALMDAYWPGPLTVVLPLRPGVLSPRVTAGLDTVGVRMPDHPVALALLAAAGCPVAAPSANRSGRPSPTLAVHVLDDLAGKIGGVLDGGAAGVGLESTVVQVQPDGSVAVLRPGGITAAQLAAVAGDAAVTGASAAPDFTPPQEAAEALNHPAPDAAGKSSPAPRAPGMKYAHYAPQGWLSIVRGASPAGAAKTAADLLASARGRGETTGMLLFEEHLPLYPAGAADCVVSLGPLASPETAARSLYAALRRFDEAGATYILAEACPETGLGSAIMNRLLKAAAGRVINAE
ncbi:L-threonylcarbamoyladenylate synthase [Paenibacillus sophorae]|uniref:Threonylcarbamoyl-AMP synthase n=1 Tax=Paenibacillus sophorae TaxID=1333845 RepID=A0A1H8IBY9_9BACL|nr:L-threonylcarbamoyladenylate synthase [Paenibacillus sophorae]QWU15916.1 threonylcarbamoyl-AMP synthase [Paenibacillus sophorae]SEN65859.1 L-threonylcarbamoyladenylate synthase [Paenibacillus sophorae]